MVSQSVPGLQKWSPETQKKNTELPKWHPRRKKTRNVEMDARLLPRRQIGFWKRWYRRFEQNQALRFWIANVSWVEPEKTVSMQKWIQTNWTKNVMPYQIQNSGLLTATKIDSSPKLSTRLKNHQKWENCSQGLNKNKKIDPGSHSKWLPNKNDSCDFHAIKIGSPERWNFDSEID